MKTTIITIALAIFTLGSMAQSVKQKDVPTPVTKTVYTTYPAASDIAWETNGPAEYKATFKSEKMPHHLWLGADGTLIKAKEKVDIKNLPYAVTNTISNDFKGMTIDDADKLIFSDKRVYYIVNLKGAPGGDRRVTFTDGGTVVADKLD